MKKNNMKFYSQKDKRWKNKKLGNGPSKIGPAGCFITSVSNLTVYDGVNLNPLEVNERALKCGAFNRDLLIAGTLAKELGYIYKKTTTNPGHICIAETNYYKNKGVPQHFFLYDGDKEIVDPLDLEPKWKKNKYPFVSYRIFKLDNVDKTMDVEITYEVVKNSKYYKELWDSREIVKEKKDKYKEEKEKLEKENKRLKKERREAETEVLKVNVDLDVRTKEANKLRKENSDLEILVDKFQDENELLTKRNKTLAEENEKLKTKLDVEINREDNKITQKQMTIIQALNGRKTYLGIAISLVALFNLTDYISPDEIQGIVDGVCACIGAGMTVIGIAHKIYKKFKK